jgi:membrane protein implicated in regulation of membrane protease activity
MSTFTRYLMVQAPGWLLVGVCLLLFWPRTDLSPWLAGAIFAAWIAKDFLLYPLVRVAYDGSKSPSEQLIGRQGVARENLDPKGYVEVGGELWHAETAANERCIAKGVPVRIRAVSGLTVYVTREGDGQ